MTGRGPRLVGFPQGSMRAGNVNRLAIRYLPSVLSWPQRRPSIILASDSLRLNQALIKVVTPLSRVCTHCVRGVPESLCGGLCSACCPTKQEALIELHTRQFVLSVDLGVARPEDCAPALSFADI